MQDILHKEANDLAKRGVKMRRFSLSMQTMVASPYEYIFGFLFLLTSSGTKSAKNGLVAINFPWVSHRKIKNDQKGQRFPD